MNDTMSEFDTLLLANFEAVSEIVTNGEKAERVELCSYYAALSYRRFLRSRTIRDIDEAIEKSKWALQGTSPENASYADKLYDFGCMLHGRYERTGERKDLEEAIRVSREALAILSPNRPDRNAFVINLGNYLEDRYVRTRQIEDLNDAIQACRQALAITSEGHPARGAFLIYLGRKLERRFEYMGEAEDLNEAIQVSYQAIETKPREKVVFAFFLESLGNILRSLYERTREIKDIEEAIRVTRQATDIMPKDHPNLATFLSSLGNDLGSRYEHVGEIQDLEEAIQVSRLAIEMTSQDMVRLAAMLNNLAIKLGSRYLRLGEIEDLEEAIRVSRHAIRITPENHIDLPGRLNNLGIVLARLFERTQKTEYLEEAIRVSRRAVESTPEDSPDLASRLNDMGNKLARRHERKGKIEDLEEAIQVYRRAVEITPKGYPRLATWLNNLAAQLRGRFYDTGNREDLEEAIEKLRWAIRITPKDHPDLAARLENLGSTLPRPWDRMKEEDVKEAILICRRAVQITPENHPDLARRLYTLALNLAGLQYNRFETIENLEEAIRVSCQAFQITLAPPFERIKAASLALVLLQKRKDYDRAYALSVEVIDLLPIVHNRSLSPQDQQYVVSLLSGLAAFASSLAIHTNEPPFKALELLERGRGVILSLFMEDRSDTSELRRADPSLCARYERLLLEVNSPVEIIAPQHTAEVMSERREKVIKELEKCIETIQQLPELHFFHKGLTADQLKSEASDGNIIIVNVTALRSDAIIISSVGFTSISLPCMDASQAQSWIDQDLTTVDPDNPGKKNKIYLEFLNWLWDKCVKPILTKLGYHAQSSPEDLPRVWWIGTGLASSFPFHAAGDKSAGPTERTFSRVLSSYASSVRALMYARARTSQANSSVERPFQLLMVAMPNTPGADTLSAVGDEISAIKEVLGTSVAVEILNQPDAAKVLRQIQQCNIAHFACHGISDSIDPSQSGLLLQTASANPKQDILTVQKLCENHLKQAEIAYLSACSTAESRAKHLVEEGLHVVSGFQVAGFRHVIGSLWPSYDRVCVEVARSFYSELSQIDALHYTDRSVSVALHKAILDVWNNGYQKRPLRWAQYIHYGA